MQKPRSLLILGGTAEAAALAREATARWGAALRVITSLAGRTGAPAPIAGEMRSGGFGGAAGLAAFLCDARIEFLVDATHPFAAQISRHARLAAEETDVPHVALVRPAWEQIPGDRWVEVPDLDAASRMLPSLGKRVFLTTGARGLEAFAACAGMAFVVRLIAAPRAPPPLADVVLVIARPPFTLDEEALLLRRHAIDIVVAKASGGARPEKLDAAKALGLPVLMVCRPPSERGLSVANVEAALAWLQERM
jgi:precorrin-6A/cobalt-precorrin-6A reductase